MRPFRYLLTMPLALVAAILAAASVFGAGIVQDGAATTAVLDGLAALGLHLLAIALGGGDPAPEAARFGARVVPMLIAIFLAPVTLVAVFAELLDRRSLLLQSGLCALLTVLLPLAVLGLERPLTAGEARLALVLTATGAAAGAVYWLIAGRRAGRVTSPASSESGSRTS